MEIGYTLCMIFFIAVNLSLVFLLQTQSPYLQPPSLEYILYTGLACTVCSGIAAINKRIPFKISHELFAIGCLLMWFAYWRQFYRSDAPMFYFYPVYFVLLNALLSLLFISRRERFDDESIDHLQHLAESPLFHPLLIAFLLLASIVITGHFLLFPAVMTLFLIRYTLISCLEPYGLNKR